jgi:hypothetical protein
MTGLRRANLILAFIATLAPLAQVLGIPNKLALAGTLWLAMQQHLYRGWGPFLGAPVEIGALAVSQAILTKQRMENQTRRLTFVAAGGYAGMIVTFFLFNNPVNKALSGWAASTLPPSWPDYRSRWEAGHALAALLSPISLVAIARCCLIEVKRGARVD